jgi:hypothetical protein
MLMHVRVQSSTTNSTTGTRHTGQYPFHLTLLECQGLSVVPFFARLRHAKRQPAMALTPPQWRSVMVNMLRVYF